MSHGDDVKALGDSFKLAASTENGVAAAIFHKSRPIAGLQYHPEVHHTEFGLELLKTCNQGVQVSTKLAYRFYAKSNGRSD